MSNIIIEDNERFEIKQIISKSGITYLEICDKTQSSVKCFTIKDVYDYVIINDNLQTRYIIHIKNGMITKVENDVYDIFSDRTLSLIKQILVLKSKKTTTTISLSLFEKKININESCRTFISNINTILKQYCIKGLLEVDINCEYMYEFKPVSYAGSNNTNLQLLLLCLMYDNKCVSSIELEIVPEQHFVSISSFTDPHFENRKYNKLLRSILLQTCHLLDNDIKINYIVSTAVNSISLYTFLQIYPDVDIGFENNPLLETYLISINKDITYVYKANIIELKKLYLEVPTIFIKIPINKENIESGELIFSKVLTQIVCE